MRLIVFSCLLMFIFAGCDVGFKGEIVVEASSGDLVIINQSNQTIKYIAGEESDLAKIHLDLSEYTDWPSIPTQGKVIIPYTELMYYDDGDKNAWIYWRTEDGVFDSFTISLN